METVDDVGVLAQVMAVVRRVPGARCRRLPDGRVRIDAGGGAPPLALALDRVLSVESTTTPSGGPAARLGVDDHGAPEPRPLLVAPGDLTFPPDAGWGRHRIERAALPTLPDMATLPDVAVPSVIRWSEIVRLLDALEVPDDDDDRVTAQLVVAAAGIAGAQLMGIRVDDADARLEEAIAWCIGP